jgi:hypothetical protein
MIEGRLERQSLMFVFFVFFVVILLAGLRP